jgi:hypothetical protein
VQVGDNWPYTSTLEIKSLKISIVTLEVKSLKISIVTLEIKFDVLEICILKNKILRKFV